MSWVRLPVLRGGYSPSQLLQDAKRRGVEVLPVDVNVSTWDSAIEGPTTSAPVRLGFSLLRGMREDVAGRIELARAARPFVDVADLARRAQLDRHDLQVLARANALRSLAGGNRRAALWLEAAAAPDRDLLRGTERDDAVPALPHASEGHESLCVDFDKVMSIPAAVDDGRRGITCLAQPNARYTCSFHSTELELVPNANPRRSLKTRAGRRSERSFNLSAVCMIVRERTNEINVSSLGNEVIRPDGYLVCTADAVVALLKLEPGAERNIGPDKVSHATVVGQRPSFGATAQLDIGYYAKYLRFPQGVSCAAGVFRQICGSRRVMLLEIRQRCSKPALAVVQQKIHRTVGAQRAGDITETIHRADTETRNRRRKILHRVVDVIAPQPVIERIPSGSVRRDSPSQDTRRRVPRNRVRRENIADEVVLPTERQRPEAPVKADKAARLNNSPLCANAPLES